jgi:pyruvate-ferredoxin/flavodoxin oxidoreductase
MMGSGSEAAHETVDYLTARGERVGLLKVRLFRPFSVSHLVEALPATVRQIAVLDRTKEAGAAGDPLYLDVVNALYEGIAGGLGTLESMPGVVGGRYGLSSKEFTPAMVKAVYDNLAQSRQEPLHNRNSRRRQPPSLEYDPAFSTESDEVVRASFMVLVLTARSERIKIQLRSSARTPRITRKDTSYTTRKNRGR